MKTSRSASRRLLLVAFALWALPPAGISQAKEYMTPGFLDRTARPMTLAALPSHAEFIKAQAVMTAEMLKEAGALEEEANKAIAALLQQKGYQVRVLTAREIETITGLAELVHSLNVRYDEEWSKAMRKPREARKGRYSVGEDAVKACSLLKVEGLVMSRIVAVGHTGGKQALTLLLSFGQAYAQSYARISLSVIEGKAGRVEGHFSGFKTCTLGGLVKKPAKIMTALVDNAIGDYPGASEVKVAKKASATTEAASDADQKSEDEAIEDFEKLLAQKNARTAEPEGGPSPEAPPQEGPPQEAPPQEDPPRETTPPAVEPEPAPPPEAPAEPPDPPGSFLG